MAAASKDRETEDTTASEKNEGVPDEGCWWKTTKFKQNESRRGRIPRDGVMPTATSIPET